ncbi:MAG: hypothetical protein UY49_C0015G0002 [Microgenomates group bacterium GW2011_GWC1_49_7]|nr:MAG: hypothetical protein UY49_C0015G0002 [Microgenomates group bacterium GW2011_GWC1_49_7]
MFVRFLECQRIPTGIDGFVADIMKKGYHVIYRFRPDKDTETLEELTLGTNGEQRSHRLDFWYRGEGKNSEKQQKIYAKLAEDSGVPANLIETRLNGGDIFIYHNPSE